ncbi:MAG: TolC family protein [Candidatus Korobacteraceae bacterium]
MSPKPVRRKSSVLFGCGRLLAIGACLLAASVAWTQVSAETTTPATSAGPITFREAIELALQHSGVMSIAAMNQWRSMKAYQEARNHYIPQLTVGSGLGYSYGFPLTLEGSAPSVVNFTSTQSLINFSLKQFIKAARIQWKAESFEMEDKKNTVILDVALSYEQLESLTLKITALNQAHLAAEKGVYISQQRLKEGVGSQLDVTKSQLIEARIRLRTAEAEGQQDVLREHLAKLVGLTAAEISVVPGSVPELPLISQEDDYSARAVANSPTIHFAEQKASAADANAKGEHRALLPFADLASQYAYLAKFNNYDLYFLRYSANNLAAGLNVKFPFLNSVQKAHAQQADADAIIAHKQVDLTKNQVGEDALKLQRSIKQLEAARDVAKLDWEVSQGELQAIGPRMQTGTATLRDQQNAELDTEDKHAAYLDAEFELAKAELQLLRITDELENWAIPTP